MRDFPETGAAWRRLSSNVRELARLMVFNFRANRCEDAIAFAYWISPKGYTPSPSSLLADEIRYHTVEKRWRREHAKMSKGA